MILLFKAIVVIKALGVWSLQHPQEKLCEMAGGDPHLTHTDCVIQANIYFPLCVPSHWVGSWSTHHIVRIVSKTYKSGLIH